MDSLEAGIVDRCLSINHFGYVSWISLPLAIKGEDLDYLMAITNYLNCSFYQNSPNKFFLLC